MTVELAAKRDQLLTMLDEGEAYLQGGHPLDAIRLGQMRWRFSRTVGAYQRLKHQVWFEPMMAAANPCDRRRAISSAPNAWGAGASCRVSSAAGTMRRSGVTDRATAAPGSSSSPAPASASRTSWRRSRVSNPIVRSPDVGR